jgi:fused signal recognition particle receptor
MFEILKKKFSELTKSISDRLKKPKVIEKEEVVEESVEERGILKKVAKKIVKKIVERKLSEEDLEPILKEMEAGLIDADVAYEVVEKIKSELKAKLVGVEVERGKEREFVIKTLKETLLKILSVPQINLDEIIAKAKKEKGYATFIFFGINGVGKSLSLTKVAYWLKNKGYKVLLAAADTYRVAGREQLENYAKMINVPVIAQQRGSDSCAVIFDARKAAEARGYDVVLADTSGRMHTKKDLLDELAKIVRVNKPDLKILVLDSLSGSDVLLQYDFFNKAVGIDAVLFSKIDVNEKGGNILSICYSFRAPIIFLGIGQKPEDLVSYDPKRFVEMLVSE